MADVNELILGVVTDRASTFDHTFSSDLELMEASPKPKLKNKFYIKHTGISVFWHDEAPVYS